jgi:hypothetical protein
VDYDSDGRVDILTGSISGKVHLFRRKPNGTFAEGTTVKKDFTSLLKGLGAPLNAGAASSVCMADWSGAGKLDLLIGTGEGFVYLVPNEGTRQQPSFAHPEKLKAAGKVIMADSGNAGPFVVDWDGDGKLDLLVGCGSGAVVFYRNVGSKTQPSLAAGVNLIEPLPAGWEKDGSLFKDPKRSMGNAKVCAADWNGDGKLDLIVGDNSYERRDNIYRSHGWVWVYLRKVETMTAGK